jgi:hypothetical protein
MGGGLMQLVAYGAQDIYLTGNPQITFFKVVYRRHTNFSMEAIQQTINGTSQIGTSAGTGTVTISRNGDLVSKVYVRCDQDIVEGVSGDKLVSEVEVEIGGQRIDRHYEEWNQIWAELTTPASKAAGYKYLTGGFTNTLTQNVAADNDTTATEQQSIMVPLNFWFCRNPGLALPLIALQYHEVKLKFTWGTTATVGRNTTLTTGPTCEVWCDYIYLDTDERRRFAQVSHEYLIEQLQKQSEGSAGTSYKLNFNHPVKELIWTNTSSNLTTQKVKLQLNGHDRFAEQDREYFQVRQPFDYHTTVPGFNIKETERPVLLTTPLEVESARGGSANGHASASTANKTFIAATSASSSVITMHDTGAPTGANRPRVGDIVSIVRVDGAGSGTTGSGSGLYVVTAGYNSSEAFTVAPGLRVSTSADFIDIHIVARVQDPQSSCSQLASDINVYSFALKPEEHQPSGTCNFSRIDNAELNFNSDTGVDKVYAVNYNVLRIMSGMGGLAYSN